jgi:hypothetical protein
VLDWLHVTLLRCGGGTPIVPPLTLYAAVDARLVRADTGAVLHHARIEHWGETFPFVGWGAGGAARFARGLDRAQNSLAEQLVQSFFVAQTPTALPRLPCGRPAGTGPPPP